VDRYYIRAQALSNDGAGVTEITTDILLRMAAFSKLIPEQ